MPGCNSNTEMAVCPLALWHAGCLADWRVLFYSRMQFSSVPVTPNYFKFSIIKVFISYFHLNFFVLNFKNTCIVFEFSTQEIMPLPNFPGDEPLFVKFLHFVHVAAQILEPSYVDQ